MTTGENPRFKSLLMVLFTFPKDIGDVLKNWKIIL